MRRPTSCVPLVSSSACLRSTLVRPRPLRPRRRWFLAMAVRWGSPPPSALLERPAGSIGLGRFRKLGTGGCPAQVPATKPAVTVGPTSTADPGSKGTNGAFSGRSFPMKVPAPSCQPHDCPCGDEAVRSGTRAAGSRLRLSARSSDLLLVGRLGPPSGLERWAGVVGGQPLCHGRGRGTAAVAAP